MNKYDNVDGLKAIATIGILAGHLYFTTYSFGTDTIVERIMLSFSLFVILFMMLSGFGVCVGYLEKILTGRISIEEFYIKRYKKILPYFMFVTFLGVLAEHTPKAFAEGFMELTLLFGLLPNNSNCFTVNGVCWTLGTIFSFYIIFPFCCFLLANKKRAWVTVVISLVIQILCVFIFMTDEYVVEGFLERSNILYALPFFLIGGLVYIHRESIGKIKKYQWLFGVICIVATITNYVLPDKVLGYSIMDAKALLLFTTYLIYAVGAKSLLLNNPLLKVISRYGLEVYLTHMMVIKILGYLRIKDILGDNIISFILLLIILLAVTIMLVKTIYYIVNFIKIKSQVFMK